MGAMQRRKGKVAERDACKALEPVFGPMRRVLGQSRAGGEAPDIDGPGCTHKVEVKNQRTLRIPAWWRQAESIDDPRPAALMFKMGGKWFWLVAVGNE